MARYAVRYLAATTGGARQLRDAVVDAADAVAVARQLAVRPADIVKLQSLDAAPAAAASARAGRKVAFPLRLFSQELAVLLDAGIPLFEALVTLREKESAGSTTEVLSSVIAALEQGQNFAQALRGRPEAFSSLFIASIEASQRTGQIAQALRRHAEYLAWLQALRDKLVGALIYPGILIAAGSLVMLFLTVFVVPRFAQIYDDLGGDLPWMSRVMLGFGQFVGANPLIVAVAVAGLIAGVVLAWRSPRVRAVLAAQLWTMPYVGERMRLVELSALYRTLGLLLQAGVTAVPAMQASGELVSPSLRVSLAEATRRVREGARLSDSLEATGLTTPVSLRMMRVGEHSGELGGMLERAATFYDEELARFTDWIGRVVSPALMLVMGVMIGGVVVLMYLPIFQVAEQIR
ncbi:type II secretion system F family protein [Aquabacterium sp.]|uniref:type II secretion system F family protein n=1 Tax=Aquabacterium sp. TaxID=1872578 RepID=UPI0035AEE187